MSSYDYYLFLPILIVATPRLLGHPLRGGLTLRVTLLGALGCSLGLALKCGLVIGALGWDGFLADLEFQYFERATTKYSYKITRELWKILFFRHYRFFSPAFYLVVLVGIGALFHRRLRPFAGTPAPWVLFGAGLCFIFAMKRICEQYHVSLSLLPYFAVAGALIAADSAAFARAIDESVGEVVKTPRGVVRHTLHHRPRRLVLGTFGVKTTAPPAPVLDFTLRLPQDRSREQRVRLALRSLVPHQTLRVQGTSVTMARPDEAHTVELTMPRRGDGSKIEEVPIRFELDRVDGAGHGVALEAIEIVQAGP